MVEIRKRKKKIQKVLSLHLCVNITKPIWVYLTIVNSVNDFNSKYILYFKNHWEIPENVVNLHNIVKQINVHL